MNLIIVALDGVTKETALGVAAMLQGKVWGFKITDLLFENTAIITDLKKFGMVFADAKLYDIPNTVSNSVRKLSALGADLITVHASGGIEMMKAAKKNAGRSKIVAVTALTSFAGGAQESVLKLTYDALEAGVDGIVCSAHELQSLAKILGSENLLKIVPGVRPAWYKEADDQKRIVTPKEAIRLGAQLLVIGRPILNADDPSRALAEILAEIRVT